MFQCWNVIIKDLQQLYLSFAISIPYHSALERRWLGQIIGVRGNSGSLSKSRSRRRNMGKSRIIVKGRVERGVRGGGGGGDGRKGVEGGRGVGVGLGVG